MKKIKLFLVILFVGLMQAASVFAYSTTASEVPTGIAVGPGMVVEVSFPTMINPDGCGYSGAYQVSTGMDVATRKAMLATLISAKSTNTPVRVRLEGCSDRPLITYIFTDIYP